MERGVDSALNKWTAPECPFRIEYSTRVLDDIRLAVVDAFFSLPRGGAEIGGILLGSHDDDRISITGYEALNCEHALGPSFILSPRDQLRLSEMTARAARNPADRQLLGWYHSHTRSEIFLSDADQDIHNRFFWEPWQIALVLKPHTFEPTRGGFFFREPDGSIRGSASYREFVLEAQPLRPAPGAGSPPQVQRPLPVDSVFRAPVTPPVYLPPEDPPPPVEAPSQAGEKKVVPITREIPTPVDAPDLPERPSEPRPDVPRFVQLKPVRSWGAVKVMACLAVGLALGGAGYQTRDYWVPKVLAKVRPSPSKELPPSLSLALSENGGQLEIRWDRNSPAIRNATAGALKITDGSLAPREVQLDGTQLTAGALSYARQNEQVDVTLIATEPGGRVVKDQKSFLGKLPVSKEPAGDPGLRQERDALAEKAGQLEKDMNFQASKIKKLERELKDARDLIEIEQRRRLGTQVGDTGKKNN